MKPITIESYKIRDKHSLKNSPQSILHNTPLWVRRAAHGHGTDVVGPIAGSAQKRRLLSRMATPTPCRRRRRKNKNEGIRVLKVKHSRELLELKLLR